MTDKAIYNEYCKEINIDDLIDVYTCYEVVTDDNGQAVDAVLVGINSEGERLFGKAREELAGIRISEIFTGECASGWIDIYGSTRSSSNLVYYSFFSPTAGRQFYTRTFIDRRGFVNMISHDISDLHTAKMMYSNEEKKNRSIVKISPDVIMRFDRLCRFVFVNTTMRRYMDIDPLEFIGKTPCQMGFPERLCEYWQERIKNVIETGMTSRSIFSIKNYAFDWYLIPEYDISQEVSTVFSICRDITESITKEKAVRESEEKYRNLVDQSVDGITLVDDRGILVEFNRGMEDITGIKREDAIGRPAADVFDRVISRSPIEPCDNIKQREEALHDSDYHGKAGHILERIVKRPDGTVRNVQEISYRFKIRNSIYTCSITRDVTEIKMLEECRKVMEDREKKLNEALELDRIRTEFFANLSHEFRTPLNIIFSSIQLIGEYVAEQAEALDYKGRITRNLKSAYQNCYRLLRLINNLIDVTKIDAGFYEMSMVDCDIVKVVEDITLSVVEYTKNKGIELVFDTDTEEKAMACDPDQIERIMLNLLSNAIKFTGQGGRIIVNLHDNGDFIVISVEDNGIGIPEEKLTGIFERFRQVDNSLTKAHEGSGIGLSLVKSLVEMHKGTVTIHSTYGSGTRIDISLPAGVVNARAYDKLPDDGSAGSSVEKVNIEFSDIYL